MIEAKSIEPKSGEHVIGHCECGLVHDVSEIMICRARDRFRDDKTMTTERCARELFDEFHAMAIRDHVPDEHLRRMCLGHAQQMAELRVTVEQWKKEGRFEHDKLDGEE
ncbi:MAG: hypothetical protein WA637_18690 [Terriglobales bacterium]